jgi:hypothetical protein
MLGFDAVGKLALAELPQAPVVEDTSTLERRPLYSRGVSYWKGSNVRSSVPQG